MLVYYFYAPYHRCAWLT